MIYKREYYKSTNYFSCDITPKRVTQYYELEIYDYGTGCASIDNILYLLLALLIAMQFILLVEITKFVKY